MREPLFFVLCLDLSFFDSAFFDAFGADVCFGRVPVYDNTHFLQVGEEFPLVAAHDLASGAAFFLFQTFSDDHFPCLRAFTTYGAFT